MSVPAAYLGVIAIWSTTPLAIKWSGEGAGFLFGVSARMALSLALCIAIMALLRQRLPWTPEARRTYMAGAVGIFGAMITVYWGAQFIPSGLISVLFGLSPLLVGMLGSVLFAERGLTAWKLAGIVLGVAGLAVVFGSQLHVDGQAWKGVLGVILSVGLYSLSMVWVKHIGASLSALSSTTGGLLFSLPLYLLVLAVAGASLPQAVPPRTALAIVYLAVFGSVAGFILFYYVLRRLPSATVSLITLLTPVLALILGTVLNGERLPPEALAGSGMILAGLAIHQWGDRLRRWRVGCSGRGCRKVDGAVQSDSG